MICQQILLNFEDIFDATATIKHKGYDVEVVPRPEDLAGQIDQLVWKVQGKPRVERPIHVSQERSTPGADPELETGRRTRAKQYKPLLLVKRGRRRGGRRGGLTRDSSAPRPLHGGDYPLVQKGGLDNDPASLSLEPPPLKEWSATPANDGEEEM